MIFEFLCPHMRPEKLKRNWNGFKHNLIHFIYSWILGPHMRPEKLKNSWTIILKKKHNWCSPFFEILGPHMRPKKCENNWNIIVTIHNVTVDFCHAGPKTFHGPHMRPENLKNIWKHIVFAVGFCTNYFWISRPSYEAWEIQKELDNHLKTY